MAGSDPTTTLQGRAGFIRSALGDSCPRCGAPGLWQGGRWGLSAQFNDHCRACGADFAAAERSGRWLYPLVMPVIAALIALALYLDDWLHAAVLLELALLAPLVLGSIVLTVRLAKAAALVRRLRDE